MERSVVQFGGTKIAFEVTRSDRRKTVALAVDVEGTVTVTAPPAVPIGRLDDVVRAKAPWILERSRRASDRPPSSATREFVAGETVLYLGRQYRLRTARGSRLPALRAGWLVVETPRATKREVRAAMARWLRVRAEHVLSDRLAQLCERARVKTPELVVTEQRARWGSCDARGTIRINWRVVQAPVALIDYVLLHEVMHLTHASHDRGFWSALGRRMPDYDDRRARLRRLGAELIW